MIEYPQCNNSYCYQFFWLNELLLLVCIYSNLSFMYSVQCKATLATKLSQVHKNAADHAVKSTI